MVKQAKAIAFRGHLKSYSFAFKSYLLHQRPLNPPPLPTPPQIWGGNKWSPPTLGEIRRGWDLKLFSPQVWGAGGACAA